MVARQGPYTDTIILQCVIDMPATEVYCIGLTGNLTIDSTIWQLDDVCKGSEPILCYT